MKHLEYNNLSENEQNLLKSAHSVGGRYINKKANRYVGAALLASNGVIHNGVSVRRTNASNSTCAERMALDRALYEGDYNYDLLAIVGFYGDKAPDSPMAPCGLCRQILSEAESYGASKGPIRILISNSDFSTVIETNTQELLPMGYKAREYPERKASS